MPARNPSEPTSKMSSWPFLTVLFPVLAAVLVYQLDSFDPAPMPIHELTHPLPTPLMENGHMLNGSELLGVGKLQEPEDILYDPMSEMIYAGCVDGWIKRVTLSDSADNTVVENWVNTGGRPLGLAMGLDGEIIVADAYKGLLKISREGEVELLSNEAEGVKFKIADGVDVARDGTIYFTDASYEYDMHEFMWDILEGKPHGRLLSYDPSTRTTQVLARHLYFANGVALSPNQDYLVYCETSMTRCRKYHIEGERKGSTEKFVDLPGLPDNIHYDGQGHFLIGSTTETTALWELALRYPFIRKIAAIALKYVGAVKAEKNGGVIMVDLEGKMVSHYYDPNLRLITSGVRINDQLYCGSIVYPYIIRLDLTKHHASPTT